LSTSFLLQLMSDIFQLHSILLFHLILNMLLRTYGDVCNSFHLYCPMYLVLLLHPLHGCGLRLGNAVPSVRGNFRS
jgi:hypothetical protein